MGDSVRYYFPQINVTTKTDGDIILEGKDETTVKLANLLNDDQLAKLKNLPESIPAPGISEDQVNTKLNNYLLKNKIRYNNSEFSKINIIPGSNDSVQVHDSSGNLTMNAKFISNSQISEISKATAKLSTVADTHKVPDSYWSNNNNIGWNRYNDEGDFVSEALGNTTTNKEKIVYLPKFKSAKQEQLNSLNELVQELATNVYGSQIGERTKINFTLTNSPNEEATNPTITKNESYYVKVGSQYIVSVYLTFNVDVTPTSTQKTLAFSMVHDIPAETPPLTLTVVMKGNNRKYTTTTGISSGKNRVPFPTPAFPATEIYDSTEITIYGSAITKDIPKESEE